MQGLRITLRERFAPAQTRTNIIPLPASAGSRLLFGLIVAKRAPVFPRGPQVIPIHARNHLDPDLFRTHRLALSDIRATPEQLLVILSHHAQRPPRALRLAL